MKKELLRKKAKEAAESFLKNDSEYRMGYVSAEQPHPLTRYLSQTYEKNMEDGVRLLFQVDHEMAKRAEKTLSEKEYALFADKIREVIRGGGKVVFSGCGSSGRLSMRLEQSWRGGIEKLAKKYPKAAPRLKEKIGAVLNIMTGGDYAVIRAVESFEDSTLLGREQARQTGFEKGDLIVGVTATGETTSILGTCAQALEDGAEVYMLICSDPAPIIEKMARAKEVYLNPLCSVLTLPCGSMALTGSTRMQSSSFEQFAAAVALEGALFDILNDAGEEVSFPGYAFYGKAFFDMTKQLLGDRCISLVADISRREKSLYEKGGLITLFADEYLLDVLTDTTERAPTFMTPPFRSADMIGEQDSWAFVKNPNYPTDKAWERCFLREPNCIEWGKETYAKLGLTENQIEKIPDIGRRALKRFIIGNEKDPAREKAPSFALWVDLEDAPESFETIGEAYTEKGQMTLKEAGITLIETGMDLLEHLAIKMMLNTLSTGVMAALGRISGNWMTCLAMSNKKLVDRSARIVSDLCKVSYEAALEEIFYQKMLSEEEGTLLSPAQAAILSFGMK
ncbi:MAG: hypothetical protein IKU24_00555 [Clostridia bacterium]|nr:hypothetical protein [Clostridia bacterium]